MTDFYLILDCNNEQGKRLEKIHHLIISTVERSPIIHLFSSLGEKFYIVGKVIHIGATYLPFISQQLKIMGDICWDSFLVQPKEVIRLLASRQKANDYGFDWVAQEGEIEFMQIWQNGRFDEKLHIPLLR